eukprot:2596568-Pleurochrysis_carterae.AAC.1
MALAALANPRPCLCPRAQFSAQENPSNANPPHPPFPRAHTYNLRSFTRIHTQPPSEEHIVEHASALSPSTQARAARSLNSQAHSVSTRVSPASRQR